MKADSQFPIPEGRNLISRQHWWLFADMRYFAVSISAKGAEHLRACWDYLALNSTFVGQLSPNFGFPVQMDALRGISSLLKIGGQEVRHLRIQWGPLDDSLATLIILTFFRAFRDLLSGKNPY